MDKKRLPAAGGSRKTPAAREKGPGGGEEQQRLRVLYSSLLDHLEEMSRDPLLLAGGPAKRGKDPGPRYDVDKAGEYVKVLAGAEKLRRELYDLPPARELWAAAQRGKKEETAEDNRVFLAPVLPEEPPDCPETD